MANTEQIEIIKDLKICHITLALFPDRKDGSASFTRGVYDVLKRKGYNITMVTGKWSDHEFNDPNILEIDLAKARYLWAPKFYLAARKYLKKNDFDIIHANGARGALFLMFSKKLRGKYISNIHDLGPFEANFTPIPILKFIEKKNAKKAANIITCSDIIRYGINEYTGASVDKMHNVYSAIDPKYKPNITGGEKVKKKLGLTGPTIIYLGRLAFYKGVDDIIKAYHIAKKEIPDLNLVIGGMATLKMQNQIDEWKKEFDDVNFVGLVPEDEMVSYYTMADVFCTYSHAAEGFGLTPVEAIACGTPVICSDMDAYKEVLQDNAYFVERQQPEKLANQYIEFFNNPGDAKKKMVKAQEFIKRYTWDEVAKKVEQVYLEFYNNKNKNS